MPFNLVLAGLSLVRRIINLSLIAAWAVLLGSSLCMVVSPACAQSTQGATATESKTPPARVPVSVAREISQADEVVITEEGERTTFEYKVNGQLRLIRVIPAVGPEYYLYPEDQTLEAGIDQSDRLIVRWKLLEF